MSSTSVRDDVQEALRDVDFPTSKGELVKALRAIPLHEYGNRDEVARSVRHPTWT
ncbi:DUF2795 domain-containing protein [Streptomyces sp. NPDC048362]|uniref:DUF2795 domain-containing protein n=1 Tax=Streptomyces sp. NPDC048362 TaxID=3365539 RepID=UPI0037249A4D